MARNEAIKNSRINEVSLQKEINEIIEKIKKIGYEYDIAINEKAIFRSAGKPALENLKARATERKRTGNLAGSVRFVLKRAKRTVYIGYDYKDKGQHGHLIEFGWTKRNGEYQPGFSLVKKTYEATKAQVLKNLTNELEKVTKKTINKIKVA
jgi:HK97 gp10 family phage protein